MNTIWSPRTSSDANGPIAMLHRCLPPAVHFADAEAYSGFLSGAWKLRLLLLELGRVKTTADPWPNEWFRADAGPVIAGLQLIAQRCTPRSSDLDDLDELFEDVGAVCLWLGDAEHDQAQARLVIELADKASQRGLSVLAAGPSCGSAEAVNFAQIRRKYLGCVAGDGTSQSEQGLQSTDASPLNQLLLDLPSDQRFQARVAVLSALAWDMKQAGRSLHGLDRRRALGLGESLRLALMEVTTEQWANDTISLLIAAVRAKNTLDTRLRNMANDRLGLLILLATARLGLRCRSFTVREICRELGAVATGM